jgi:DNA-directed RNA polymerase subunit M/transcription elongation factor TFIIS
MKDLETAIKHCEEVVQEKRYEYQECLAVNDIEEAMNCGKCGQEHEQLAKWLKELKSLKEKDEPKAVGYEGDGYADGAMVVDYAFCPNCDHETEVDSENWECEFCPNCGQRLRWDE